MKKMTFEF
jgi:hypothetical protein